MSAPRDPATRLWSQGAQELPPAAQVPGQLAMDEASACCLRPGCPWSVTGTPGHVEREARRHSGELTGGPGHATSTRGMAS